MLMHTGVCILASKFLSYVACIVSHVRTLCASECLSFVLCFPLQGSLLLICNQSKGDVVYKIRLTFTCPLVNDLIFTSNSSILSTRSSDRQPKYNDVFIFTYISSNGRSGSLKRFSILLYPLIVRRRRSPIPHRNSFVAYL